MAVSKVKTRVATWLNSWPISHVAEWLAALSHIHHISIWLTVSEIPGG